MQYIADKNTHPKQVGNIFFFIFQRIETQTMVSKRTKKKEIVKLKVCKVLFLLIFNRGLIVICKQFLFTFSEQFKKYKPE